MKLGDHAALFYRSRKEQFEAMMPYVQTGLSRNSKVVARGRVIKNFYHSGECEAVASLPQGNLERLLKIEGFSED